MKSKPISRYIRFGTGLRYLQDADEGDNVHGQNHIINIINSLFLSFDEFDMPVTKRAALPLQKFRDKLAKSEPGHKLTSDEASKLNVLMNHIRKTLFAEAGGKVVFIVTDKRIDADKLLSNVSALMAPGVFDSLSSIARYDFEEAGKSIAFELPTAAAYHLLRGTEAVLRDFYCSKVRRGRCQLMWGPMVSSLRGRRRPPPAVLLDNLDNIRLSFRNPTQHPDKTYDIDEVQDLFGLCVDVVNRMAASFALPNA